MLGPCLIAAVVLLPPPVHATIVTAPLVSTNDAIEEMKARLRRLKEGADPGPILRQMRTDHRLTSTHASEVKKYTNRFLRKQDDLRLATSWALMGGRARPTAEELLSLLDQEEPALRETAAWQLGVCRMESPALSRALLEALGDADEDLRMTALWAVGRRAPGERVHDPEGVPGSDAYFDRGLIAIGGGGSPGPSFYFGSVGEELRRSNFPLRYWEGAVDWIQNGHTIYVEPRAESELTEEVRSAVPALLTMLDDPDERIRYLALSALEASAPTLSEHLPKLMPFLGHENDQYVLLILAILSRMGSAALPAAERVESLLEGSPYLPRTLSVLIHTKPEAALEHAIRGLPSEDLMRVYECTGALAALDSLGEDARIALEASFLRPNYLAAAVLLRFGEESVPTFRRGLQHPFDDVKGVSLVALTRLGKVARAALPEIQQLQTHDKKAIAEAAAAALAAIE